MSYLSDLPFSDQDGIERRVIRQDLSQVYGLGDFWFDIFEDSDVVQDLLGAQAITHADLYSRMLQLFTGISLDGMAQALHSELKLEILELDPLQLLSQTEFPLPESIISSRFIGNTPVLPSVILEKGVDYVISEDGKSIRFADAQCLEFFASRQNADGKVQYSLWVSDAVIDEDLIYSNYGKLIGVNPQTSSDFYKTYVQSLFFLRTQGPTINTLLRGVNLSIGIPLARFQEEVVALYQYDQTRNWLVVTESNVYEIPYGLDPSVKVGDVLERAQPLAQWVEVKDYLNDGKWWVNLRMPPAVLPNLPQGVENRYISEGGVLDDLMVRFLKTHTFLIRIRVGDFKKQDIYDSLMSIITEMKPAYTYPFYIWTLDTLLETIDASDELSIRINMQMRDVVMTDAYIDRSRVTMVTRGDGLFFRNLVRKRDARRSGELVEIPFSPMNVSPSTGRGCGTVTNFLYQAGESYTSQQLGYARLQHYSRNNTQGAVSRSVVRATRAMLPVQLLNKNYEGARSSVADLEFKRVPLMVVGRSELDRLAKSVGLRVPVLKPDWSNRKFTLCKPKIWKFADSKARLGKRSFGTSSLKQLYKVLTSATGKSFPTLFASPAFRLQNLLPVSVLTDKDYLEGIFLDNEVVSLNLRTRSKLSLPSFYYPEADSVELTYSTRMYRGGAVGSVNKAYKLRGNASLVSALTQRIVSLPTAFDVKERSLVPLLAMTESEALAKLKLILGQSRVENHNPYGSIEVCSVNDLESVWKTQTDVGLVTSFQGVDRDSGIGAGTSSLVRFFKELLNRTQAVNPVVVNPSIYQLDPSLFGSRENLLAIRIAPGYVGFFVATPSDQIAQAFLTTYGTGVNLLANPASVALLQTKSGALGRYRLTRTASWGKIRKLKPGLYVDSANPNGVTFTRAGTLLIHKQIA